MHLTATVGLGVVKVVLQNIKENVVDIPPGRLLVLQSTMPSRNSSVKRHVFYIQTLHIGSNDALKLKFDEFMNV